MVRIDALLMLSSSAMFVSWLAAPVTIAAPVPPTPPREGVIVISYLQDGPPAELLTPAGRELGKVVSGAAKRPFSWPQAECPLLNPRFSRDAKRIVAVRAGYAGESLSVWGFDVDSKEGPVEPIMSDLHQPSIVPSHDGTKLYGSSTIAGKESEAYPEDGPYPRNCWTFDLKSRKRTVLAIPIGHEVVDLSPDGTTLLTKCKVRNESEKKHTMAAFLVPLDTLKPKQLAPTAIGPIRFSPDGTRVLGFARNPKADDPSRWEPAVYSIADESLRFVSIGDRMAGFLDACWSPDGKRIALVWQEKVVPEGATDGRTWRAARVTVCEPDGTGVRVIARREYTQTIIGIDWK